MSSKEFDLTHKKAQSNLMLAADCLKRAFDGIEVDELDTTAIHYALDQLAKANRYTMLAYQALSEVQGKRQTMAEAIIQRKRIRDNSYSASVDEALSDPDGLTDGLQES